MKWYTKYLTTFEKSFSSIPLSVIQEIRTKYKEKESNTPIASVILIAHNESTRILSSLWSLCDNQCDFPIEIFVINNNSTDETEDILKQIGVKYFNESRKGPGYARQLGLDNARGKYHLCIDSDTIYPPRYINTHINALMEPGVVGSFGLWSFIPDKKYSNNALRIYEWFRDLHLSIQAIKRPELCVRGMVFGFKTEYGRIVRFRTDILRGEDGSMALGLKKYGKLRFLKTKEVRAVTSNKILLNEGSLINNFMIRISKAIKEIGFLFKGVEKYDDDDDNLIKNN